MVSKVEIEKNAQYSTTSLAKTLHFWVIKNFTILQLQKSIQKTAICKKEKKHDGDSEKILTDGSNRTSFWKIEKLSNRWLKNKKVTILLIAASQVKATLKKNIAKLICRRN